MTTTSSNRQLVMTRPTSASVVAATTEEESTDQIAFTQEKERRIEVDDPFVSVESLEGEKTNLVALIDTGNPVSFGIIYM